MSRLQIRLFGPYFNSFSIHSYGYEPSNELKSVLKHPNFRFDPYSPTVSAKGISFARSYGVYYRRCSETQYAVVKAGAYLNGHEAFVDDFEFYTYKHPHSGIKPYQSKKQQH